MNTPTPSVVSDWNKLSMKPDLNFSRATFGVEVSMKNLKFFVLDIVPEHI